jgi:hypothetical protein
VSVSGTSQTKPLPRRIASRLRLVWDWYTDLGFGGWVLSGGVLVAIAFGVSLTVGHGESTDTACDDAQPYVQVINQYDGKVLNPHQAALLQNAATQLQADADDAVGHKKQVLAYAAQIAGAASSGAEFDGAFAYGRFQDACDFSSQVGGLNP